MGASERLEIDVTIVVEADPGPRNGLSSSLECRLTEVARSVLVDEGKAGTWEVAFVLVDDDRMQDLHRQFMGIDEPTDVMTFERSEGDGEPGHSSQGGDIIISVDRAVEQSVGTGHEPDWEVLFLAIHGMLHLTGWVDQSDEQRAAMLSRGEEILRRLEGARDA